MSHVALARKWRPQRFEDVIGQRGVVDTLKNAIATGRLAQSFIFAGPRGVGKTTTARILARALNCVNGPTGEPCGVCDACREIAEGRDMDVLEIDGATYTGVDAVREVIVEPLSIAPMRDRYKVFIIDEVHRLSKNAFDALLKSIEEPPPYVKFMMATTELHQVPVTIQSRSQVFELKALSFSAIREQLRDVTTREQVAVDDAAIALVARAAEGSMRDALSALDQILAFTSDAVTAADVSTVLGLIGRDLQFDIVETVAREDLAGAFDVAATVVDAGFDLRIVCRELARLVRDLLVVRIDPTRLADPEIAAEGEQERLKALAALFSREDLMRSFDLLSRAEFEVRGSSQPRHAFEMALVKWIHLRHLTPLTELLGQEPAQGTGAKVQAARSGFRGQTAGAGGVRPTLPGAGAGTAASLKPQVSSPRPQAPGPTPQAPSPTPQAPSPTPQAPGPRPQAPGPKPQASSPKPQAPSPRPPTPQAPGPTPQASSPTPDLKSALMASVREHNKAFFGMVVAQAQKVEIEGDRVTFTFAPVHKSLRAQLDSRRSWLEELARAIAGRPVTIVSRESEVVAVAATETRTVEDGRRADLTARAKAEPAVQAILDVFGGEIEDVEEIE